jgi:hypothetical protein
MSLYLNLNTNDKLSFKLNSNESKIICIFALVKLNSDKLIFFQKKSKKKEKRFD